MPRLDKTCVTQYVGTGCDKQLRFSLHPDDDAHRAERDLLELPHRQVRPALNEITRAGDEWGEAKVHDLRAAFGEANLVGGACQVTGSETTPGLRYAPTELLDHLTSGVTAGQFLVEVEYDAGTPTFEQAFGLDGVQAVDVPGAGLDHRRARPDLIEVIEASGVAAARRKVTSEGLLESLPAGDKRLQLRIIDVKLTSEPGPQYFSELSYYCITLAAWLIEHGLDDRYVVHPDAAVWPGSETESALAAAVANEVPTAARRGALHEDLEMVPIQVFLADVRRFLAESLPRVLATPYPDLEWAVTPRCQGCESLGQRFNPDPGSRPADWDPRHCLPLAETTQDLSRIPFVSRGSTRVMRRHGVGDVAEVAGLPEESEVFQAHHRLRGQRQIISTRADALTSNTVARVSSPEANTVAIPAWAKLRLYVTADFDPGSAITLAFGLNWAWLSSSEQLETVPRNRVHYVAAKTAQAEWDAYAALLDDMAALMAEARGVDADAQVQVYVWDSVTFDHLTRVTGRHLGRVMAARNLANLSWLFPPDQATANPRLVRTPAVSVVRDAVRSLLSMDLAHTYTLLETARRYHPDNQFGPEFYVPRFWSDPFTDQIPPERAHQLWRGRRGPHAPTQAQLMSDLQTTVKARLRALGAVTDRLSRDLSGGRLPRQAPKIRELRGPDDVAGTSHLGVLLLTHARLQAALEEIDVSRVRALPVAEREAKFAAAQLSSRITDQGERRLYLISRGLGDPGTRRQIYHLHPASRDVSAKIGDLKWAIAPQDTPGILDLTAGAFIYRAGDQDLTDRWPGWEARRTPMSRVLGIRLVDIDRPGLRLVVDFEDYRDAMPLRQDFLRSRHLQLDTDLVLDPIAQDFFTFRVRNAVTAIGNPPQAVNDARIQTSLGITRNPRRGNPHPVADFLWDAAATANQPIARPATALRARLEQLDYRLNDSQWTAWQAAMTRRLTLIWGPPGTGKTSTLRSVLAAVLEDATSTGTGLRIAVAAGTYTAVENVLAGLRAHVQQHWRPAELRFLHSGTRTGPADLPDDWVVDTTEPGALQRVTTRLAGDAATVVASTTQQLAKLLDAAGGAAAPLFDVIILDEAGQLDVAHALLALAGAAPDCQLVVAGDPKQLPPIHHTDPPEGLESLVGSIYEFFADWHAIDDHPLTINYRSNAEIVDLARAAGYPDTLTADQPARRLHLTDNPPGRPGPWPIDVTWKPFLSTIADADRPVTAVTYPEGEAGQWNQFEADLVADLVTLYASTAIDPDTGTIARADVFWTTTIGVVTPHRAQRARIIELLTARFVDVDADPNLPALIASAVDTVERFQGQEREIILASYAVGDPDTVGEEAEFLHDMNRFNVLATRAKSKLVVIASDEVLTHTATDLEVIRSSEMLKDFAGNFCAHQHTTDYPASDGGQTRPLTLRWR